MIRSLLHRVRDLSLPLASQRPFVPIKGPVSSVVVIRPDHFGDLLMINPALEHLSRNAPSHEPILMAGPWNKAVANHIAPDAEHVFWPFPGFERQAPKQNVLDPYRQIGKAADFLRQRAPQAAIIARDDHWWGAWMAREAGIPIRIGYNNPKVAPFLTHILDIPASHYVVQNLELVRGTLAILGYDIPDTDLSHESNPLVWPVSYEAGVEAHALLESRSLDHRFVVIHPGSGAQVKLWPSSHWCEVIDTIRAKTSIEVVVTGSPDELELCTVIEQQCASRVYNLAGHTSLFSLAELFRSANLVLGMDSGPLHLATAVETPSIHLYGPSDVVRYGPWGSPQMHQVISAGMSCPDCGNLSPDRSEGCGCMTAISAKTVSQVAIEMLGND
jgi:heptosyltransferase III